MMEIDFKVNDRVRVSATATGTKEMPTGWIDKIEYSLGWPVVSVIYDAATSDGKAGITVTNIGLITKLK